MYIIFRFIIVVIATRLRSLPLIFCSSQKLLIDVLYPKESTIINQRVRLTQFYHVSKGNVVLRYVVSEMRQSQCTEINPSYILDPKFVEEVKSKKIPCWTNET